jgi:hypothetical protein
MAPRLVVSSAPGVGGSTSSKGGRLKEDGSFEVEDVAPGTWQIRVEEGFLSGQLPLGVVTVQIDDDDVEGVSLTVHAPHLLKGVARVDGANVARSEILSLCLESSDGPAWEEATSPREDGSFEFENAPSGRYRVHVRGAASDRYYVKRIRYGSIESPDAEFSLSADGDTLEVTLSAGGARVSGVVKRDGADVSASPQVVLLPDTPDAELRRYDTHLGGLDQSGAFAVKEPVRPGEYTLYAFEGVPDGAWTDAEFIKEIESKGIRIKVADGDAKVVEVPLIPRSDIAALLTRLGMDYLQSLSMERSR